MNILDYTRVEIVVVKKKWPVKLYLYTANELQRSRCSEIGWPVG